MNTLRNISDVDSWIYNVYTESIRGADMETTVVKWGNSQGIRLNRELLKQAGININDRVIVETDGKGNLVIRKAQPSIKELMSGYEGGYKLEEYDWGEAEGRELW